MLSPEEMFESLEEELDFYYVSELISPCAHIATGLSKSMLVDSRNPEVWIFEPLGFEKLWSSTREEHWGCHYVVVENNEV